MIPNAYKKLSKLVGTEYDPGEVNFDVNDTEFSESKWRFKRATQNLLKQAKTSLQKCQNKLKSAFIKDRVAEIRQGRNSFKPTQFFKRTDPNSIYSNHQLYNVLVKENKRAADGTIKTTTTTSSEGDTVKKVVGETWGNIMSKKKNRPQGSPLFFKHKALQEARK